MTSFVAGAILPKLNTGDIIFQLLMFLLLVFLLRKFAFGPLLSVMRDREQFVSDQIDAAEKSREEAAILLEEQRSLLKQSREEALANVESSRKLGEEERERIIGTARKEAERMSETAKQEIEHQKQQSLKELRGYTTQLSVLIASKVIERELKAEDQQKLIDDVLREVGDKNE